LRHAPLRTMPSENNTRLWLTWPGIVYLGLVAVLALERMLFPERAMTATGPYALLDGGFALGLTLAVFFLAAGIGGWVLTRISVEWKIDLDRIGVASGIGLGAISMSIFGLGVLGILTPPAILITLVVMGLVVRRQIEEALEYSISSAKGLRSRVAKLGLAEKLILLAGVLLFFVSLVRALVPPWGYDALMYHLVGPRLFLQEHTIVTSSTRWLIDAPNAVDLLFCVGMAFGSDTFANLMHLQLALLVVLSTFAVARLVFSPKEAWLAVGVFLGILILPEWASIANVDFGSAFFEVMSIYAFFKWAESRATNWLRVAGIFAGLSLGSKYLALPGYIILAFLVVWVSLKGRSPSWFRDGLTFTVPALVVASPWYLRTWLSFGDPLFPMLGGGARLDPDRMRMLLAYLDSYASPQTVLEWLSIPIRMYTSPSSFSEIYPILGGPSLMFPFLFLYPAVGRSTKSSYVIFIALARFISWTINPGLLVRFLIATYAILSVGTAYVLVKLKEEGFILSTLSRVGTTLLVLLLALSVAVQLALTIQASPLKVITGKEGKQEFLLRSVPTHAAVTFARSNLPPGSKIMTTGDGRTYYCGELCLDSDDQFLWMEVILRSRDPLEFLIDAGRLNVTHILVSWRDIEFFREHSQTMGIETALSRLVTEILPVCGNVVYSDANATLYELNCR